MPIDYGVARQHLEDTFTQAELDLLNESPPSTSIPVVENCDTLFQSNTQAYRELLLGCVIARLLDRSVNIRQPYVGQGANAFSGRSLDENVINPFLQEKRVPSTRGPYLSVFRRSVQFEPGTGSGLRDQPAYEAFLALISHLEVLSQDSDLQSFLRFLLYKFAQLREASEIPISRLQRISLEQYDALIEGILTTPSGGRFPVLLVVSMFSAIKEFFNLDWEIDWQGINVADRASGAGGDITVSNQGQTVLAIEITERPIDRSRVIATFNTKIAPAGIEDYLFFVGQGNTLDEARQQARQYFAQGHEINFLEIKPWILMSLATLGRRGRDLFNRVLISLLEEPDIPRTLKVSWNQEIARILG